MKSLSRIIEEAKDQLYFDTFSSAVQYAKERIEKRGFIIDEDDWFQQITTGSGRPKNGQTFKAHISLLKNNKAYSKMLHISVTDLGKSRNNYELNYYVL